MTIPDNSRRFPTTSPESVNCPDLRFPPALPFRGAGNREIVNSGRRDMKTSGGAGNRQRKGGME